MASLNKVMLIGNLTRDPEIRYTPKGTAVTDIGLAINRVSTGENGERQEETTFVDVTLWGRTAEIAGQYLSKGKPVFIEGRLQMDQWQDKTSGEKRSRLKIVAESMQLLGSRGEGQGGAPSGGGGGGGGSMRDYGESRPSSTPAKPPRSQEAPPHNAPEEEDDIPF
jgi:single-strand DNA-binding protein